MGLALKVGPHYDLGEWIEKAVGPFIGPRGGKWADAQHKIPWKERKERPPPGTIYIEKKGRRLYFRDAPFAVKDKLKAAGAKWDPQEKSWWMGSKNASKAETLAAKLSGSAAGAQKKKIEFKTDMDRRRKEGLVLRGNTYAIKDKIKAAGGVWDSWDKSWLLPDRSALEKMTVEMSPAGGVPLGSVVTREQMRAVKQDQIKYKASKSKTATPNQVNFALRLIDQGLWHDSDAGQYTDAPTGNGLELMSSYEVSMLIDDMKGA